MAQTSIVKNGVPTIELEEVVIGSQFKMAVFFERLVSEDPDVFEPIDFSAMTLQADIKLKPSKDVLPAAEFVCETRVEPGWIDLSLDGSVTVEMLEKKYEASLKVWPTASPEKGDTLLVIILPMNYRSTR